MGKKDTPESFPAGNRRDRPHAPDGWNPDRDSGKAPYDPAEAERRRQAHQRRERGNR